MAYTKNYIETKSSIEPVLGLLLPNDNVMIEDDFDGSGVPDTDVWETELYSTSTIILNGSGELVFTQVAPIGSAIPEKCLLLEKVTDDIPGILFNQEAQLDFSLAFTDPGATNLYSVDIIIGYVDSISPFHVLNINFDWSGTPTISSSLRRFSTLANYPQTPAATIATANWTVPSGYIPTQNNYRRFQIELLSSGRIRFYMEKEDSVGDGGEGRGLTFNPASFDIPEIYRRGSFGINASIDEFDFKLGWWRRKIYPYPSSSGEIIEFDLQQSIQPNSDTVSIQELFEGATLGNFENVTHEPIDGVVANPSSGIIEFPKVTTDNDSDKYMLVSKEITEFGTKSGFYTIEIKQKCDTLLNPFSGIAFHIPEGESVQDYTCITPSVSTPAIDERMAGLFQGIYISIWWGVTTVVTQSFRNSFSFTTHAALPAPAVATDWFTIIFKIGYDNSTSKYLIRAYLDDGTQDPKTAILDIEVSDASPPLRGRVAMFQGALEGSSTAPPSNLTKEKYYIDHIKIYGQVESPLEIEDNQGYFYNWGDTDTDGWTIDPTLSHAYYAGEGLTDSEYNYLLYITTRWNSPTEIPSHQFIPGSVWVKNRNPIAAMAAPSAGITNAETYFNGSLSQDPEGGALIYYFNPGDGSGVVSQTDPLFIHTYTVASNPLLSPPNDTGYDWTFWVEDSIGQQSEVITGNILIYDSDGLFADVTLMHNPTKIAPKRLSSGSNTALPDSEIGLVQRVAGSGRVFNITGYHCASISALGGDCQADTSVWQALAKAEMEFMDMLDKTGQLVKWDLPRYGEIKGFLFSYSNEASTESEFIYDYTVELHEIDENLIGP